MWLVLLMAIFSTVLPTLLIAESVRRMGANAASLVGRSVRSSRSSSVRCCWASRCMRSSWPAPCSCWPGVLLVTLKPRAAPTDRQDAAGDGRRRA